ncbi:MAG: class I SAM-dependent methyltransferase [Bacteroidetes bacterium]|nr:class I SAM-dependent methyltransferase [Bacteroidota bacterium]
MQERHTIREKYFEEQDFTTKKHVIPYLEHFISISSDLFVCEIGCGEGGNLKPFVDFGCKVTGIDISENKIANAKLFFKNNPQKDNLTLISEDIYKITPDELPKFDIILMRDTLEHIPNQDIFLNSLKKFIKPTGKIFISFPPWRMPFGGHQQVCRSSFLSKLPYFHILPVFLYVGLLKLFGESKETIRALLEIKETRISINRFKKIIKKRNFEIIKETYYLINPNYEIKFNLKVRKLPSLLNIPTIRDFFSTAYYCVIRDKG